MRLILVAFLSLALLALPALADTLPAAPAAGQVVTVQTAPATPASAAATQGATTTTITTAPPEVKIPWGDWLDAAINQIVVPLLGTVVLTFLTILGAKLAPLLPPALQGMINAKNTAALDQLIVPSIATGLKSVGSDVSGKTIDIPNQNAAAVAAANYAIEHGSAQLIKWAGGPEGIRQKIQGRIDMLSTGVTAQAISTVAPTSSVSVAPTASPPSPQG